LLIKDPTEIAVPTFYELSTGCSAPVSRTASVSSFTGRFLKVENGQSYFDWASYKSSIDKHGGCELFFDFYKHTVISENEDTVSLMAERVVRFLCDALKVTMDSQLLLSTIEEALKNLRGATPQGNASVSPMSSTKTHLAPTWEYHIGFTLPVEVDPEYLYSMVSTIKIEADITNDKSWWGTVRTRKDYTATIDAMRIVVHKDFKLPPLGKRLVSFYILFLYWLLQRVLTIILRPLS
jgi:hypothetical protein